MRILVTGAGGYIGRHLVPRLRDEGHEIVAQDSRGECAGDPPKGGGCWHFDWANPDQAYALRRLISPDTVIHLAGCVEINLLPNPQGAHLPPIPGPCDIGELYRDNVVATANVLQYCLQAGVKHLVFASTQAVYGMPVWDDMTNEFMKDPLEHYAASKLAAEKLLEIGRKQELMISILRLPGIYGGDRKEGAVYNMCRDALQKGEIHVTHPFPLPMNVMHIEDVVGALTATVLWQPPNKHWATGLFEDVSGREECSLDILAEEIASLVPGCKVWRGVNKHPTMQFWDRGLATRTTWTPKPRKERLAQVLEEIQREAK